MARSLGAAQRNSIEDICKTRGISRAMLYWRLTLGEAPANGEK